MLSLLKKLSYFDPATGGTLVIANGNFLWKEGKKSPEASKATRLVQRYGWKLRSGDDSWLTFKQKGNPGELTVIRGVKRWTYSLPGYDDFSFRTVIAEGVGLDSLYDALEKGMLTKVYAKSAAISRERALDMIEKLEAHAESAAKIGNPEEAKAFSDKAKALRKTYGLDTSTETPKSKPEGKPTGKTCPDCGQPLYVKPYVNPTVPRRERFMTYCANIECDFDAEFGEPCVWCDEGKHLEAGPFYGPCPNCGNRSVFHTSKQEWDFTNSEDRDKIDTVHCSKCKAHWPVRKKTNVYAKAAAKPKCPQCGSDDYGLMPTDFETAKCNDCGKNWDHGIVPGINDPYGKSAREIMHDDSGTLTGLRSRPDYGESDSYVSEMNEANSKGACLVLNGSVKTASGTEKMEMYVTSVEYDRDSALKLASFQYSPDPVQAKVFRRSTADNLVKQIRGLRGAVAHVTIASDLLISIFNRPRS
jgi:ribosomal protein L37AE/L43A